VTISDKGPPLTLGFSTSKFVIGNVFLNSPLVGPATGFVTTYVVLGNHGCLKFLTGPPGF